MASSPGLPRPQKVQRLKTYSKRVPVKTEDSASKRRCLVRAEPVVPLPLPTPSPLIPAISAKVFPRSSIESYFKPAPHPSSSSQTKQDITTKSENQVPTNNKLFSGPTMDTDLSSSLLSGNSTCQDILKQLGHASQPLNSVPYAIDFGIRDQQDLPPLPLKPSQKLSGGRLSPQPSLIVEATASRTVPASLHPINILEDSTSQRKGPRRLNTKPNISALTISSSPPNHCQPADDYSAPPGPNDELLKDYMDRDDQAEEEVDSTLPNIPPSKTVKLRRRPHPSRQPKQPRYQQMQLDLDGASKFTICPTCRMDYNPTIKDDTENHQKYHRNFLAGLRMPQKCQKLQTWHEIKDGTEHCIMAVDYRATDSQREQFEEILKRSYRDLAGVAIGQLWSRIKNPHDLHDQQLVPRYRLYVYFVKKEAVSLVLAERTDSAGPYCCNPVSNEEDGDSKNGTTGVPESANMERSVKVFMMVDRLWTLLEHRRKGYATKLVDVARETFINGLELDKGDISFSPPTQMGHGFAARYCKEVYKDKDFEFLVNPKFADENEKRA